MIHDQFGHAADSRRQLLQQSLRFLQIVRVEPLREPPVHRSEQVARLLHLALVAPEGGRGSALATTADNTNNNVATNGRSLHTHRRWFAAKNPSWRSRTQSWTPHGTPPKGAPSHRAMHKKMQVRAVWSRRATALIEWHRSCGICSRSGLIDLMSECEGLTPPTPPAMPSLLSNRAYRILP
jgi:hypothetical protein